jgi:hypothetical protein
MASRMVQMLPSRTWPWLAAGAALSGLAFLVDFTFAN